MDGAPGISPTAALKWQALFAAAASGIPPAMTASTFLRCLSQSASAPVLYRANGDRWVVKLPHRQSGHGSVKAMVSEQVAGRCGILIGAPVPEVGLLKLSPDLWPPPEDWDRDQVIDVGVYHCSRFHEGFGDRFDGLDYIEENRGRFAYLELLYRWVHCESDHQLIYREEPPYDVLSVDHGAFLPGGPDWSLSSLWSAGCSPAAQPFFGPAGLTRTDRSPAIDALRRVTDVQIAAIPVAIPASWGISNEERLAIAAFLACRRDALIAEFDGEGADANA